jgi:N6-adenosine-specific RNA methylase IME4
LADEGVANVVLAPKREHSRKPDEVNRRIDRLYPDASKIELFARSKWPNWDAWGNQVGLFD